MAYTTITHPGGSYQNFWPDDTEDEFYLDGGADLQVSISLCMERFPGTLIEKISVRCEYIHTEHLGSDQYDSGDYTSFLKISRCK